MSKRVSITINNHIADVRLSRPEKMNAIDEDMFQGIIKAGEELNANPSIRCIVLSGEGKSFCAGIDLANFDISNPNNISKAKLKPRTHGIANKWQKVAWQWREMSIPVVAAVHGVCFGGGLQIMLGADIKYITADAKLSIMEMKWGIFPDMAGTVLMRHSVRDDIIRELTYTNRVFSGEQAVEYGFATHISSNPHADAMKLATEIASKSPSAIVKAKKVLNAAPYLNPAEGMLLESAEQEELLMEHNQVEAVFSSMQKRDGNFKDYRE